MCTVPGILYGEAKGAFCPHLDHFCPLELDLNNELAYKSAAVLNCQLKCCPFYIFENRDLPLLNLSFRKIADSAVLYRCQL